MKLILTSFIVLGLLTSCGSTKVNELKKSFAEKVSEKVKAASIHSLGCSSGDAVYSDVKFEMERSLKVEDKRSDKSAILVELCKQGVRIAFPSLINMATGKLPDSWKADGCSLSSVGNDIEKLVYTVCNKIE